MNEINDFIHFSLIFTDKINELLKRSHMNIKMKITLLIMLVAAFSLSLFVNFRPVENKLSAFWCLQKYRPQQLEILSAKRLAANGRTEKSTQRIKNLISQDEFLNGAEVNCRLGVDAAEMRKTAISILPEKAYVFRNVPSAEGILWELSQTSEDKLQRLKLESVPRKISNKLNCSNEMYNENGSDGAHGIQTLHPTLMSLDFPLKGHLTCVKAQVNRGTCIAFSSIAVLETMVSVATSKKMNFSEQHYYAKAKLDWTPDEFSSPRFFGDGLNAPNVFAAAINEQYSVLPGIFWKYNPSNSRVTNNTTRTYTGSCNPQGTSFGGQQYYSADYCSDTNHQGKEISCPLDGLKYLYSRCTYNISSPYALPAGQPIPKIVAQFQLPASAQGISIAQLKLANKTPIFAGVWVTNNFDQAPGGIIEVSANDSYLGGHGIAIVGAVENDELPSVITPGQGGGYFIIKNSYGTAWGLNGYALMSWQYFLNHGQGMTFLSLAFPSDPQIKSCNVSCSNNGSQTVAFSTQPLSYDACSDLVGQKKQMIAAQPCGFFSVGNHLVNCSATWGTNNTISASQFWATCN
jgi:hypothetical protein